MATPINKILTNQQQVFSPEELANVSASLSAILGQGGGGGGGEPCASAWLPSVDENGNLSWTLSMSTTTPDSANIMGPRGTSGTSGAKGEDGTSIILQSVTDVEGGKQVTLAWGETPSTSSFVIPSGANGANGVSPIVTITDAPTTEHPQGGKTVTITDADHPTGQSFDIWNGIDGQGATVNLVEGDGIQITHEAGTTNYTIGVSADYALKSELPDVTDMATKTWVSGQGYLTAVPDTYATKTYANDASANALSQAQSWVGDQGFLKNTDLDDYATKSYANDASAAALNQAESWVESQNYLKSVLVAADGSLAGSGTTNSPLALKTSAENAIKTVSAKSNVDITSAGVTTVTNTSGTTINKFAQYGEVDYHPTPRMFLCATADSQADIVSVLGAASGMGAVVFVVQSI